MSNNLTPDAIERKSKNLIRSLVENTDKAIFRDLSGRDMGIDGMIEIIDNEKPTGMIALVQIKGTADAIQTSANGEYVSCRISRSCARYSFQRNVPVILIFVGIKDDAFFYFADVQSAISHYDKERIESQDYVTARIPSNQRSDSGWVGFFRLISDYYGE